MDKETVEKMGRLARLELNEEEVSRFAQELTSVFSHIEKLSGVEVENVQPTTHTHGAINVMREDKVEPSLPADELKKLAPDHSGRFIRVKLIVE